jgi:type IV fimbrial biogenesis protein FimT
MMGKPLIKLTRTAFLRCGGWHGGYSTQVEIMRFPIQRRSGIGLMELLITMGILSALASMALPNFAPMLDRLRVVTMVAHFQEAINLSRTEAIRRHLRVDLVPMRDKNWATGWQVLIDADSNQLANGGDTVLHTGPTPPSGLRIDARLRDPKPYLAFDPSGRPRSAGSSTVPQIGSLIFTIGNEQRKIIISFLGRVRSCDPVRAGSAC